MNDLKTRFSDKPKEFQPKLRLVRILPGCIEEKKISLCFSAHFCVMMTCWRLFCAYAMVPSNGFIFSNWRSFVSSFTTSIPPVMKCATLLILQVHVLGRGCDQRRQLKFRGGGGGGGGAPIWKGWGCLSEILNLPPKRDQSGCGQTLCRPLKE